MTEQMEQMIYDEGFRRGYEKGKADRPKGEWIPCSERLPSMEQDVLAWIEVERRIACCNYCNGHWFDAIMNTMVEPIAWMPLPKPYERSE